MNATRPYLALCAKLLMVLVLVNGLACSFGHGQMLRPLFEASVRPATTHGHGAMQGMAGMHDMADKHPTAGDHSLPMRGMNSAVGDCLFAGSLPSLLLAFALIGWLLRLRAQRPRSPLALFRTSPRATLPNLNPRAP